MSNVVLTTVHEQMTRVIACIPQGQRNRVIKSSFLQYMSFLSHHIQLLLQVHVKYDLIQHKTLA